MPPPVEHEFKDPPKAGLMFDTGTGEILWERHPDRELPIASLTKMLTAWMIVTAHRPGERVALRTYYGDVVAGADTFTVDPSSLDAEGHAIVHWPALALAAGGAFETAPAGFVLTLPLGMGLPPLRLQLERASIAVGMARNCC